MRVLLSTYGSRVDAPRVGLRGTALGAEVRVVRAPVATGVMQTGVCG